MSDHTLEKGVDDVIDMWHRIREKKARPETNRDLGGLYSIALGALPLTKKPFWASCEERERYHVTKKYGITTQQQAVNLYCTIASSLLP